MMHSRPATAKGKSTRTDPLRGGLGGGGWGLDWESATPELQVNIVKSLFQPLDGCVIYQTVVQEIKREWASSKRRASVGSEDGSYSDGSNSDSSDESADEKKRKELDRTPSVLQRSTSVDYSVNKRFTALVRAIVECDVLQVEMLLDEDEALRGSPARGKKGGLSSDGKTGLFGDGDADDADKNIIEQSSKKGKLDKDKDREISRNALQVSQNVLSTPSIFLPPTNIKTSASTSTSGPASGSGGQSGVGSVSATFSQTQEDPLVDMIDSAGFTPLHIAAVHGTAAIARLLIKAGANVASKSLHRRLSPTHCAAWQGNHGVLEVLLDKKGDPNSRSSRLATPLHGACVAGSYECVNLLVRNKADISAYDSERRGALHYAAVSGSDRIKDILMKDKRAAMTLLQSADELGYLPLHFAATFGHVSFAESYITPASPVDSLSLKNRTPLMLAVKGRHLEMAKELIRLGASINAVESAFGHSVLHTALVYIPTDEPSPIDMTKAKEKEGQGRQGGEKGDIRLDMKLTDLAEEEEDDPTGPFGIIFPASPKTTSSTTNSNSNSSSGGDNSGKTKSSKNMPKTKKQIHYDLVTYLIDSNADVMKLDSADRTPLHFAAAAGSRSLTELLLNRNATVDSKALDRSTPLKYAAQSGSASVVKLLMDRRANPARVDRTGTGPLHMAAAHDHPQVFALLLGFSSYQDALYELTRYAANQANNNALAGSSSSSSSSNTSAASIFGASYSSNHPGSGTSSHLSSTSNKNKTASSSSTSSSSSSSVKNKSSNSSSSPQQPQPPNQIHPPSSSHSTSDTKTKPSGVAGLLTSATDTAWMKGGALADKRSSMIPLNTLLEMANVSGWTPLHYASHDSLLEQYNLSKQTNSVGMSMMGVGGGGIGGGGGGMGGGGGGSGVLGIRNASQMDPVNAGLVGALTQLRRPTTGLHAPPRGSHDVVKLLIAAGVDVTRLNKKGHPALTPSTPTRSLKLLARHYIKQGLKPLPLCAHTFFWREVGFAIPPREIDPSLIEEVTADLLFESFQRAWARYPPLHVQTAVAFFSLPTTLLRPLLCADVLTLAAKYRDLRLFAAMAATPALEFLHQDPVSSPLLLAVQPQIAPPPLPLAQLLEHSSHDVVIPSAANSLNNLASPSRHARTPSVDAAKHKSFFDAPTSPSVPSSSSSSSASSSTSSSSSHASSSTGQGGIPDAIRHQASGRLHPPWLAAIQLLCYGPLRLRRMRVPLIHAPEFEGSSSAPPPGLEEFLGLALPLAMVLSGPSYNRRANEDKQKFRRNSTKSSSSSSSAADGGGPSDGPPTLDRGGTIYANARETDDGPKLFASYSATELALKAAKGPWAGVLPSLPPPPSLNLVVDPSALVQMTGLRDVNGQTPLARLLRGWRRYNRMTEVFDLFGCNPADVPGGYVPDGVTPKPLIVTPSSTLSSAGILIPTEAPPPSSLLYPASQTWIMCVCALLDAGMEFERDDITELFLLGFPIPHYRRLRSFIETAKLNRNALRMFTPLDNVILGIPDDLPTSSLYSNGPDSITAKAVARLKEMMEEEMRKQAPKKGKESTKRNRRRPVTENTSFNSASSSSPSIPPPVKWMIRKPSTMTPHPAAQRPDWTRRWVLVFGHKAVNNLAVTTANVLRDRHTRITTSGLQPTVDMSKSPSLLNAPTMLLTPQSPETPTIPTITQPAPSSTSTSSSSSSSSTSSSKVRKSSNDNSVSRPPSATKPVSKFDTPLFKLAVEGKTRDSMSGGVGEEISPSRDGERGVGLDMSFSKSNTTGRVKIDFDRPPLPPPPNPPAPPSPTQVAKSMFHSSLPPIDASITPSSLSNQPGSRSVFGSNTNKVLLGTVGQTTTPSSETGNGSIVTVHRKKGSTGGPSPSRDGSNTTHGGDGNDIGEGSMELKEFTPMRTSQSSANPSSSSPSSSSSAEEKSISPSYDQTGNYRTFGQFFHPNTTVLDAPLKPAYDPRDPLSGWEDLGLRVESFSTTRPLFAEVKGGGMGDGDGDVPDLPHHVGASRKRNQPKEIIVKERDLPPSGRQYWQMYGRSLKAGPKYRWELSCDHVFMRGGAYGAVQQNSDDEDNDALLEDDDDEAGIDWGIVATAPSPSGPDLGLDDNNEESKDADLMNAASDLGRVNVAQLPPPTPEQQAQAALTANTIPLGARDQSLLHLACLHQRPRAAAAILCFTVLTSAPLPKTKPQQSLYEQYGVSESKAGANTSGIDMNNPAALAEFAQRPRGPVSHQPRNKGPNTHPQDLPALFAQDSFGLGPLDYCTDPLSLSTVRAWASVLMLAPETSDVTLMLRSPNLLQAAVGKVDDDDSEQESDGDDEHDAEEDPSKAEGETGCCGGGTPKTTQVSHEAPVTYAGAPGSAIEMQPRGWSNASKDSKIIVNSAHGANGSNNPQSKGELALVSKPGKNPFIHPDQRIAEQYSTFKPSAKDVLNNSRIPVLDLLRLLDSLGLGAHRIRKKRLGLDAVLVSASYGRLLLEAQSYARTEPSMSMYLRTELSAAASSISAAAAILDESNNTAWQKLFPCFEDVERLVMLRRKLVNTEKEEAKAAIAEDAKAAEAKAQGQSGSNGDKDAVDKRDGRLDVINATVVPIEGTRAPGHSLIDSQKGLAPTTLSGDDKEKDQSDMNEEEEKLHEDLEDIRLNAEAEDAEHDTHDATMSTAVIGLDGASKEAEKRRTAELQSKGEIDNARLAIKAASPGLQRWGFFKLLWDSHGAFMRPPPVLSSSHRQVITDRILSGSSEIRLLLPKVTEAEIRDETQLLVRGLRFLKEDPLGYVKRSIRHHIHSLADKELDLWDVRRGYASARQQLPKDDIVESVFSWARNYPIALAMVASDWYGEWASPINFLEWAEDGRIEAVVWPHAPEEVEVLVDAWGNDYIPDFVTDDKHVSMFTAPYVPPEAANQQPANSAEGKPDAQGEGKKDKKAKVDGGENVGNPTAKISTELVPVTTAVSGRSSGGGGGGGDGNGGNNNTGGCEDGADESDTDLEEMADLNADTVDVAKVAKTVNMDDTGPKLGDPLAVVLRRRETHKGWLGSSFAARLAAPIFTGRTFRFMFKETPKVDDVPASFRYTRLYCGEQATFYFVFTSFIMHFLIPVILSGIVFTYFHFADGIDNNATPWNALIISLWSTWLIEMWTRKQSELSMHWGRRQFKNIERISLRFRPLLRPDGRPVTKKNRITGEQEPYYPTRRRQCKIAVSVAFTVAMMACVYFIHVSVLAIDKPSQEVQYALSIGSAVLIQITKAIYLYMAEVLTEWENYRLQSESMTALNLKSFAFCYFNEFFSLYWIALGQDDSGEPAADRLFIQMVSLVGTSILTNLLLQQFIPWLRFRAATRTKTVCCCIKSNNSSFISNLKVLLSEEHIASPLYDDPALLASSISSSLPPTPSPTSTRSEVTKQTATNSNTLVLTTGPTIPANHRSRRASYGGNSAHDAALAADAAEEEEDQFLTKVWKYTQGGMNQVTGRRSARLFPLSHLARRERLISAAMTELLRPAATQLFSDYLTIMILLGYIMGFAAIFPEGPLLVLIAVWLERQGDLTRYLTVSRRVLAQPAGGIGAWSFALSFLSYASIVSNGVLLFYTTNQTEVFLSQEPKFLFVCYILLLGAVKSGLSRFINDAASWVASKEERAELKAIANERKYGHLSHEAAVKEVAVLREKLNKLKRSMGVAK